MEKLNLKTLIGLLCLACICQTANSQVNIQAIWDSQANFIQHSIAEFSEEEYILAGTVTPGPATGASDILVLKVHNNGTVVWARYVDYGDDEFVGSVKVDAQQNIVLTGYTGTNGTGNKNLIIVKLNGNGNLLGDIVIQDQTLNYGLYGLDIVQAGLGDEEREYIVVGTGVQDATEVAPKYAFVIRVDQGLDGISWSKIYRSTLGQNPPALTTKYDSFNHILKINHPTDGEIYFLTGSGVISGGNRQMVANDLIDPTGVSEWIDPINPQGSKGRRPTNSQHDHSGVMALYDENAEEFYVLQPSLENLSGILKLDDDGGFVGSYFMHNHVIGDYNNLITGMAWSDPSQEEIVFSGYHVETDLSHGFPILFKWRTDESSTSWNRYHDSFQGTGLYTSTFDFIVRPLNRNGPSSGMYNSIYYQPKALINVENLGYRFLSPGQITSLYNLDLLRTDLDGIIEGCQDDSEGYNGSVFMQLYNNFGSTAFPFKVLSLPITVKEVAVFEDIVCGDTPQQRPFMGIKESDNKGIEIYPNPARDVLHVSGLSSIGNAKIILYDMKGRVILSQIHEGMNGASLNVSSLESGLYFLKVSERGKNIIVERIVKE